MKKNSKHKCCMCGNMATWHKEKDDENEGLYFCDECTPKSKSCFEYSSEGFPLSQKKERILNQFDILYAYSENKCYLTSLEIKKVGTSIAEILMDDYSLDIRQTIPYNLFMSKFGDKIKTSCLAIGYKNGIKKFYHHFKKALN